MTLADPLIIACVLLAIGLLLAAAEVVLPGGVLGALAGVAMAAAVTACFFHSSRSGAIALVALLVMGPILGGLWAKNLHRLPGGKSIVLQTTAGDTPPRPGNPPGLTLGQAGVVVSELRPAGECEFGPLRVQARSEGGVIPAGTPVRVVAWVDGRATVRPT